jgi:hypothetical protein
MDCKYAAIQSSGSMSCLRIIEHKTSSPIRSELSFRRWLRRPAARILLSKYFGINCSSNRKYGVDRRRNFLVRVAYMQVLQLAYAQPRTLVFSK